MTKEELELLNWVCPKDCPDRKAHKIEYPDKIAIVSCHYVCEKYLKATEMREKFNRKQQELNAISSYDLENFRIKKSIRAKKGR